MGTGGGEGEGGGGGVRWGMGGRVGEREGDEHEDEDGRGKECCLLVVSVVYVLCWMSDWDGEGFGRRR